MGTAQLQVQGVRDIPRDFMLMVCGIPLGAIWELPRPMCLNYYPATIKSIKMMCLECKSDRPPCDKVQQNNDY